MCAIFIGMIKCLSARFKEGGAKFKSRLQQNKFSDLLKKYSRFTMRLIARFTNMSLSQVRYILKKRLKLKKINGRWISYLQAKVDPGRSGQKKGEHIVAALSVRPPVRANMQWYMSFIPSIIFDKKDKIP
jgi:hypothetical protein